MNLDEKAPIYESKWEDFPAYGLRTRKYIIEYESQIDDTFRDILEKRLCAKVSFGGPRTQVSFHHKNGRTYAFILCERCPWYKTNDPFDLPNEVQTKFIFRIPHRSTWKSLLNECNIEFQNTATVKKSQQNESENTIPKKKVQKIKKKAIPQPKIVPITEDTLDKNHIDMPDIAPQKQAIPESPQEKSNIEILENPIRPLLVSTTQRNDSSNTIQENIIKSESQTVVKEIQVKDTSKLEIKEVPSDISIPIPKVNPKAILQRKDLPTASKATLRNFLGKERKYDIDFIQIPEEYHENVVHTIRMHMKASEILYATSETTEFTVKQWEKIVLLIDEKFINSFSGQTTEFVRKLHCKGFLLGGCSVALDRIRVICLISQSPAVIFDDLLRKYKIKYSLEVLSTDGPTDYYKISTSENAAGDELKWDTTLSTYDEEMKENHLKFISELISRKKDSEIEILQVDMRDPDEDLEYLNLLHQKLKNDGLVMTQFAKYVDITYKLEKWTKNILIVDKHFMMVTYKTKIGGFLRDVHSKRINIQSELIELNDDTRVICIVSGNDHLWNTITERVRGETLTHRSFKNVNGELSLV